MKIRSHLVILVLVTLVPVLLFGVAMVGLFARQERAAHTRGMIETSRALALTVDRELAATIAALESLATSDYLRAKNLARFEAAMRALQAARGWPTLALHDASGQHIIDLEHYPGSALPKGTGASRHVVETGRAAVSDLIFSPELKTWVVSVAVPTAVDGRLQYILSTAVLPATFAPILTHQRVPSDWTATIIDRAGIIVARNRAPERFVGTSAPQGYLAQVRAAPEGLYRGTTVDGSSVYAAFATSPLTGWSVVFAAPAAVVEAGFRQSLWITGGGAAVLVVIALALAWHFAGRITSPIRSLSVAAEALGRGGLPPRRRPSLVREVNEVRAALARAADLLRQREQERERLLTEQAARADAEASAQRLSQLQTITDAALGWVARGRFVETLLGRVREVVDADAAAVLLPTKDGNHLALEAAIGTPLTPPDGSVAVGSGLVGLVAAANVAMAITDLAPADLPGVPKEAGDLRSAAAVPIPLESRPPGVLAIGSRLVRVFTREELTLLQLVADRLAMAVEQARLYEAESRARADAEAASLAKDQFLAMLAHELRNPLASIRTAVHVIGRAGAGSERAQEAQRIVERQVNHLARLLDDLLDVSRITRGRIELNRVPTALAVVITDAVEAARPLFAARRHELTVSLPPEPVVLDADATRLTQVFGNLLNNAAKYTPPGGRVQLTGAVDGDVVEVHVSDTGVGIAADMLPRVFDLFAQADRSLSRSEGGLGIGLTLVHRLVELHGGTVSAHSEGPGRGTEFVVRLPRAPAPSAAVPAPVPGAPGIAGAVPGSGARPRTPS